MGSSRFLILFLLFFSPFADANQTQTVESLSLQEIGKRASENALLLQSRQKDLEASELDAEGSDLLPNPNLAVQLGEVRSGGSSGMTIESTLTQTIPFPGKRGANARIKSTEAKISGLSLEEAKRVLQHQAILVAFQWMTLNEEVNHFKEREKRFRLIRDFQRSRPMASPAMQAESFLIDGQMELIEKGFLDLKEQIASLEWELAHYLQSPKPVQPTGEWIDPTKIPAIKSLASADWEQGNPELKKNQLQIELADGAVTKARRSSYPDITLGAGHRLENVSPSNNFWYGSIGLSIPIFDRSQYSAPAARARLEGEKGRAEVLRSRLKIDFQQALRRLEIAQTHAKNFSPNRVEKLEKNFQLVEREFIKGRVTTATLLQMDAQTHETLNTIYDSQYNLAQRLSEVLLFRGASFTW